MAAAGWVLHVRTSNAHAATVAPRQAGGATTEKDPLCRLLSQRCGPLPARLTTEETQMTDRSPDPTLDRLLRHMAWANAQLIARLAE